MAMCSFHYALRLVQETARWRTTWVWRSLAGRVLLRPIAGVTVSHSVARSTSNHSMPRRRSSSSYRGLFCAAGSHRGSTGPERSASKRRCVSTSCWARRIVQHVVMDGRPGVCSQSATTSMGLMRTAQSLLRRTILCALRCTEFLDGRFVALIAARSVGSHRPLRSAGGVRLPASKAMMNPWRTRRTPSAMARTWRPHGSGCNARWQWERRSEWLLTCK
mmetsp:Transcript_23379/g.59622  ORF Transcript_23379/g.59622 Transcript_23379/m.59622 type:complete len:219 (+) Transcript_23379:516-1172(+)